MEYYTVKPAEPSAIYEALRDFLDGALDPLLQTNQNSLPIKFLYKYFGPGSVASELNKVITREDGFFYFDGVKIIADSALKAEIAAELANAAKAAVLGLFGVTALPIGVEVVVAGVAAAGATWVYQSFVQPVLGHFHEVLGEASTRLEIADSTGRATTGVVYRNGLAAEGKSTVDAVLSLLNFSAGKFDVNSHVAIYTPQNSDKESIGYDILAGNHLARIAGALGVTTTEIANRSGLDANSVTAKNSDLLAPYLSGADFSIMQTGAKLSLHMYDKNIGDDLTLLKKEISIGGDLSGLDLQAAQLAVFGTDGGDNIDVTVSTGKVYVYGGMGSDTIRGGAGGDVLWGDSPVGPSNGEVDFIHGAGGNDEIFGGGGGDQLFGDDGADYIEGGAGDDTIDGGTEMDEIWGGVGSDTIHGGEGNDVVRAGSSVPREDDTGATNKLYGDGGRDEIYGAEGNDQLYGGADEDKLSGGAGNDILMGQRGDAEYRGGDGADIFVIDRGAKRIVIKDASAEDRLVIRASDVASLKDSEDQYSYKPTYSDWAIVIGTGVYGPPGSLYASLQGHWYIEVPDRPEEKFAVDYEAKLKNGNLELTFRDVGYKGAPEIVVVIENFKAGMLGLDSVPHSTWADHWYDSVSIPIPVTTQIGTESDGGQQRQLDASTSAVGDDHLLGSNTDDDLLGLSGNDVLEGKAGVDVLDGGSGDDVLTGGAGDDELAGGGGSDTYYYSSADGSDIIGEIASETDVNTLVLTDLNLADVTFSFEAGSSYDLIVTIGTTGMTIRVFGQFDLGQAPLGLSQIEFADGSVLDRAAIELAAGFQAPIGDIIGTEAAETLTGDSFGNWIKGNGGDDIVDGAGGNDEINGGAGSDVLNGGAGNDIFVAEASDGNDIINGGDGAGDELVFWSISSAITVDLQNGTATGADIGSDTLAGIENVSAAFNGGNDILIGSGADNVLDAGGGNDTITGGAGDDTLSGGYGSDTYHFSIGDGDDFLFDNANLPNEQDLLVFGPGLDLDDVNFQWQGQNDAKVTIANGGGSIVIAGQLQQGEGIELFQFSNGASISAEAVAAIVVANQSSSGDDLINGTGFNDTITGGTGNDHIRFVGSGDVIVYAEGDGNDIIEADSPVGLQLSDLSVTDLRFSFAGTDLLITVVPTGDTIRVKDHYADTGQSTGLGQVTFADGTVWDRANIQAASGYAPTDAALTGNSIAENAVIGTLVGTVIGVDPDPDATLTYSLTGDAGGRFAINATTGAITVANGTLLDYETNTSHSVTVRVTDQDGVSFDKSFMLDLTNVNESPTEATLIGGSVAENAANGTAVGTVAGIDADAGATLTYGLIDDAGGRFAISAATGQITVLNGALLNYEAAASHSVTVRVTDQGGLTFDKSFTLGLTDINEAPTDATLAGGSVAENAAIGTIVATVAGVDPDAGAVLTYSLTDNAGGRFAIDAATGQITVADGTLLDYEATTSHAITVHVVDQGGLAFDKVFTIAVTDVNEAGNQAPSDATLSGGTIAENSGNGAVVGTVAGVDPDNGAVLTYSLTDNAGGRFAVNATSGQITVADGALLDYETATSHNVTVRVTDQGGLTYDEVFVLAVTDVAGATLNGTSAANTLTGTAENDVLNGLDGNDVLNGLGGNDTLDGGTGNDTMTGGAGNDVYIVDAADDVVNETANEGIDEIRTSLSSYTLGANVENVTATTSTALTASGNALDNVIKGNSGNDVLFGGDGNDTLLGGAGDDVLQGGAGNDIFDGQGGQNWITTGTGQDTLILNGASGYLQVDDFSDGNDKINMRGTGVTAQNAAQNVTLTEYAEGGVLVEFGTSQIWFENIMPGQITFDDFVFDTSGGGDNHAPTNATLSGGSIAENSTNGTVVGTVTGVDPDAGAVLSYSLTDNAGGRFAINAATGQITVANGALLDYETATSHDVVVRIVDQGGLSFDKVFTLAVTDASGVTQNGTSAADTLIGTNEGDTLNGLGGNDTLNGLGGNDVLDGGAGNDTMNGGTGNDIYIVDSSNDVVNESANEGIDEVQTSLSSYTLGDNFENLTGTNGGGFTAAGNALDNIITGSSGNDVLFGEDGNDVLRGGAGDDVMQGGAGNDTFQGQGGVKWITTGAGADVLVFNAGSGAFQVDDFTDGSDKIDMRGTGVTAENAAENVTLTEYAEGGVLVQFGSSEIWLANVMPGQITFADDFILS